MREDITQGRGEAGSRDERTPPLVSIVIATYNAGAYLRDSLLSALRQSYPHIEILLVDDGSTDGSIEMVSDLLEDPRVRLLEQPRNLGKSAAMNRALDALRGEYYALQDADDESHPTRIARQMAQFFADTSLAAVFVGHRLILGERRVAPTFSARDAASCRYIIDGFRPPALDPTAAYRVAKVGDLRYDETLRLAEGLDYILRVGERDPMIVLGECLYDYRVRGSSLTQSNATRLRDYEERVAARAAERRGVAVPVHQGRPGRGADNNLAAHFIQSALDLRAAGLRRRSLATGLESIRLRPSDPHHYKALAMALLPLRLLKSVRRRARAAGLD